MPASGQGAGISRLMGVDVQNLSRHRRVSSTAGWHGQPFTNYDYAHTRIRRLFGSATEHLCVSCGGPADGWALDNTAPTILQSPRGHFSPDPLDYAAMCAPCHKQMDMAWRRIVARGGFEPPTFGL